MAINSPEAVGLMRVCRVHVALIICSDTIEMNNTVCGEHQFPSILTRTCAVLCHAC